MNYISWSKEKGFYYDPDGYYARRQDVEKLIQQLRDQGAPAMSDESDERIAWLAKAAWIDVAVYKRSAHAIEYRMRDLVSILTLRLRNQGASIAALREDGAIRRRLREP